MMKKILAISFVLLMCLTSVVLVADEDSSADVKTGKIRPYDTYNNSNIFCSTVSVQYFESSYTYGFEKSYCYYTDDPTDIVEKFVKGETSDLGSYVDYDHLEDGQYYYAVYGGYSSGSGSPWYWKSYQLRMETIFLPAGTYEIEFSSTTMDKTTCRLRDLSEMRYFEEFKDGSGKVKVPLTEPCSFYVYASYSGSGQANTALWSMDYKISPAPPDQKIVDCEKEISVGTNKKWICYESVNSLSAGTYQLAWSGDYYLFVRNSPEEKTFLSDYVNKGIVCPYSPSNTIMLTENSHISLYKVADVSRNEDKGPFTFYNITMGYETITVDCNKKDCSSTRTNYSFYAGQSFSIAVDFDTSQYSYVILKSGMMQVCMDPKKLYTITSTAASEYEIYAMMADGSTASMDSATIKIHTESISDPDGAGLAFAVVSIGFCAIAFFMLFWFGRRPKWDDSTGLPKTGSVGTVVNEVPEVTEEVPEAPAEEPLLEEPKEE